jgi:GAF domain-containing protein
MCTPVNGTDNQAFGVLFCGSPKKKAFLLEEKEFLQYIARSLGLAVERLKRVEELKKGVEMNSCVMATYISSARSLADTYASILEGVMTITSVDLTLLMLWDNTNGLLSTIMKRGRLEYFDGTGTCEMGEGIPGRVLEKGEPYWTTDLQQDPFFKSKHENTKAVLCLPLRTMKGEPLGVIVACRYAQTQDFSNNEVDTASTFALRASMALENAFLHEKERGCIVELKSPPVSQKAA